MEKGLTSTLRNILNPTNQPLNGELEGLNTVESITSSSARAFFLTTTDSSYERTTASSRTSSLRLRLRLTGPQRSQSYQMEEPSL